MTPADEAQQGGTATIASHIESKTSFHHLQIKMQFVLPHIPVYEI